MRRARRSLFLLVFCVAVAGCATRLAPSPAEFSGSETVAFGRISAALTGPTPRAYPPEIRFFELVNEDTQARFRIDVQAAEAPLYLALPPGTYALTRIMINEGAFQAMANPGPTFRLDADTVTYIGTLAFGIASPTYNRELALTVADELDAAAKELSARYPVLAQRSITSQLPTPASSVTRLYETEPYPLIWWFRRHHTT